MKPLANRIEPLAPFVYNLNRIGSLQEVVAPPYDLIGPELQDELYNRSPCNIVRLELNRDPNPYESAARTLNEWLQAEVFVRGVPAIYLYTQAFQIDGRSHTRNALMVRIRLEDFSEGHIVPHERTFLKAKEDRLRLLYATRINISPVFGLYPSEYGELRPLIAEVAARTPSIGVADTYGVDHRLRVIDDPAEIALVQNALAGARILIADGHHRYETALEYRQRMRESDANPPELRPYDYVMMALVAFDDLGLVILPTHRVLRRLSDDQLSSFRSNNAADFEIDEFDDVGAMRAKLASMGSGYIGAVVKGLRPRIMHIRNYEALEYSLPHSPKEVRELDVSILHALVFAQIFGINPDEIEARGNIEYTIDAQAAAHAVISGAADAAFLLNPSSIEEVEAVSKTGATMPEKSTYFYPKLITGLLMNPLY